MISTDILKPFESNHKKGECHKGIHSFLDTAPFYVVALKIPPSPLKTFCI